MYAVFGNPHLVSCVLSALPTPAERVRLATVCRAWHAALVYPEVWDGVSDRLKCLRLHALCFRGDLRGAQKCASLLGITVDDVKSPIGSRAPFLADIFNAACGAGHTDVAQWLDDKFGVSNEIAADALVWACGRDRLATAQWLVARFDCRPLWDFALRHACGSGHFEVTRWAAQRFGVSAETVRRFSVDGGLEACAIGDFRLVRWMVDCLGVVFDHQALRYACKRGHLKLAQWLAERFPPEFVDLQLEEAACHGHFDVCRWLVTYFGPERCGRTAALARACRCGHLELAQWFSSQFDMADTDFGGLIINACGGGHLEVVRWLVESFTERFGITRHTVLRNRAESLRAAARWGYLPVVRYLVEQFVVVDPDVIRSVMDTAGHAGHVGVARWLANWGGTEMPAYDRQRVTYST
jgi:hypothetical protein